MIRCAPGKVKWNKPISAGTYDRQVLILVDKSRPLLTNSRHKNVHSGKAHCSMGSFAIQTAGLEHDGQGWL